MKGTFPIIISRRIEEIFGRPEAQFEDFSSAASSGYKNLTGGANLFDDLGEDGERKEPDLDWQVYDEESRLERNLPNLWRKYGKYKVESATTSDDSVDQYTTDQVFVPGLGTVKEDGIIFHKSYGRGVVQNIMVFDEGAVCANIEFEDRVHPMMLNAPELLVPGLFSLSSFAEENNK